MTTVSQEDFKKGMQQLAASVTVIATKHKEARYGLTATAVSSVTNDPPTLLVCINKNASAHQVIQDSQQFSVNILGSEHEEISNTFASTKKESEEKFAVGNWDENNGIPVLKDALASFTCKVSETVNTATHTIFLGVIEGIQIEEKLPLIYASKGYRTITHI